MGKYNPGQPVMPGMGGYGEDAPLGAYDMGQQRYTSLQQPQSFAQQHPFRNVLANTMMGVGQGMTGQPYLTNYQNLQQGGRQTAAEQQFNIWKANKEFGLKEKELGVSSIAEKRQLSSELESLIGGLQNTYKTPEEALKDWEENKDLYTDIYGSLFDDDKEKLNEYIVGKIKDKYSKKAQKREKFDIQKKMVGEQLGIIAQPAIKAGVQSLMGVPPGLQQLLPLFQQWLNKGNQSR